MSRVLLLIQLFAVLVFGHGFGEEHLHLLGSFHLFDFVLIAVGVSLASLFLWFRKSQD
jgi:hypothetical protein